MLHDTKRMTHDIIHATKFTIQAKKTHRQSVTFFAVRGRLQTKLSDLLVPDSAIQEKKTLELHATTDMIQDTLQMEYKSYMQHDT